MPSDLGDDGTLRLRAYLPRASWLYLSGHCAGRDGCGRGVALSIPKAIELAGDERSTVRQLERRLVCRRCGRRNVTFVVAPDARPLHLVRSDPLPVIRQGIVEDSD